MSELLVEVSRRVEEADGIASFELIDSAGATLPAFSAGAHIDVHVAPGLVRQYSLCDNPAVNRQWRIAVLREAEARGGSAALHDRVGVGDRLRVSAPRNHFGLVEARKSLLFAGGIEITPILAMAQSLHASGAEFDLHYCARSVKRMAFRYELERSGFASRVQFHTDNGHAAQRFDAERVLGSPGEGVHLCVCGSAGFMSYVLGVARQFGWPDVQCHREHFAAPLPAPSGDSPFEVVLARTGPGHVVLVGKSVVEVLRDAGVEIPTSCEVGVCGTCMTHVVSGTPDHRDAYLTEAERVGNRMFTPCCSRSRTPVLTRDL